MACYAESPAEGAAELKQDAQRCVTPVSVHEAVQPSIRPSDCFIGDTAQFRRAPSCLQEALQAPNPAFAMLEIGDLIPEKKKAEYEEAGGKL